ncbi:unnamed protein product [Zymoseptoria tritici ST99CH_1A5]|uniref:Heterokaryon incompatibility domain-containing protein n=1 Tax=Zymoseptoria tritici ST99CH_1A5 TaxID=1276529 RepID=A0A1Y6LVF7_ZYMTR|nr:unnamed protein product [Zymoseptoria tritici ST99CH_1A5]
MSFDCQRRQLRPYRHTPLPDPATYIRLLTPAHSRDTNLPSYTISTWAVDEAPPYNAISYTWGEPSDAVILINNRPLHVRQNCQDALVQANGFDSTALLWIDALCIHQHDVNEKDHQVQRMYGLFSEAENVLACIGGHENDSKLLFDLVPQFRDVYADESMQELRDVYFEEYVQELRRLDRRAENQSENHDDIKVSYEERFRTFLEQARQPIRDVSIAQIKKAYSAFRNRAYWSRLWITQEVAGRADTIFVLCGNDTMYFDDLFVVWEMMDYLVDGTYVTTPLGTLCMILEHRDGDRAALRYTIEYASDMECYDSRDRIYGLLALIDWDGAGIDHIFPDYSRSSWSLAVDLMLGLEPKDCIDVLRMLRIDAVDPDIRTLVYRQRSSQNPGNRSSAPRDFDHGGVVAVRLTKEAHGMLICETECSTLGSKSQEWLDSELLAPLSFVSPKSHVSHGVGHERPREVHGSKGQRVALVSCNARVGDLLVLTPFLRGMQRKCFVLRCTSSTALDVIGNGIMNGGCGRWLQEQYRRLPEMVTESSSPLPHQDVFKARFVLTATPEEIMVFTLGVVEDSDLIGGSECKPSEEAMHLMGRPVGRPSGAARLVPRESYLVEIEDACP